MLPLLACSTPSIRNSNATLGRVPPATKRIGKIQPEADSAMPGPSLLASPQPAFALATAGCDRVGTALAATSAVWLFSARDSKAETR